MGDQPLGIYWAVEVGQLAGVSRRTVGQWARHGYIRSSRSTTSPRVYSFQDVAEAIVVHELIARGVPHREVRRTVENTREEYGDWPLTAARLATTVHAPGHGPTSVLLHLEDADLDVGRHHGGQAVLRYSTLEAVTQLLRRGGWAIREHPDIHHVEVHPDRLSGAPTIRGRRISVVQVAELAEEGYPGLRILREGYELNQPEIRDAVRWHRAVRQYDRAA
jgi:uncharacterized protein (DUF433 family)/DNA-binding transcriptional MerR regulator